MTYDPSKTYIFTNEETSETFTLEGGDPLAEEAITKGLPISVTSQGERFIYPFVEQDGDGVIIHAPDWFKESEQYAEWRDVWAPTIPNTAINAYSVSVMNEVLGRLGREAAANRTTNATNVTVAPERATTTIQETQQHQQDFWSQNVFQNYSIAVIVIGIAVIITVAFGFAKSVKSKIKQKRDFNGIGWALANAAVGLGIVGIVAVILASKSIDKEINKTKSKKYKKYAKGQMGNFVKTYAICFLIKIVIVIIKNVIQYR